MDEEEEPDVVKWYLRLQEKTTREAINSEEYGLTSSERSFLRSLCGYEGKQRHKTISSAGWYVREALKLESEIPSTEPDNTTTDAVGERIIGQGQIPSIFTKVQRR